MGIQIKARLGHPRHGRVLEKVTEKGGKGILAEIKYYKRSMALNREPDVSHRKGWRKRPVK